MRAVDTNVLVRLLVRDDPRRAQAAEEFIAPGAWVSHLVLAETVWVLDAVYDRTPRQLAAAIELLLDHQSLTLQDAEAIRAALAHFRTRPALGFTDCLVLEVARKAGHLPMGTLDKAFSRMDGTLRLP